MGCINSKPSSTDSGARGKSSNSPRGKTNSPRGANRTDNGGDTTATSVAQVVRVTTDITDITDITMVTMDMTRDTIVGTTEEAGMVVATEMETEVEMEVAMEVVVVTEEVGAIAAAEIDIPSLLWLHQHLYSELPR
ncbi:hypothetical protein F444_14275 [Phytophthora nicotianae P1976]|uniref:Uncharacterized protein n=1 Tax=Phytophthora nicotianae P1976 TaxID=1317066 RepID=A0A080ZQX4_PHYNI|nr:hypothetical protein F444_14275 [Phytophthora nicotianae P1976]